LSTQKWAKVFEPKVLLCQLWSDLGLDSHLLFDIRLGQIEQELALDYTGIIDDDGRVANLVISIRSGVMVIDLLLYGFVQRPFRPLCNLIRHMYM